MINDFKLGLKTMKYGLNGTGFVVLFVLCFLLGTVLEIFMPIAAFGGMWFGMIAQCVVQCISSFTVSTMVQSSSYKKKLQTTIPTMIVCMYLLIANTYNLFLKWMGYRILMNWSESDADVLIVFEPGEFSVGIILSSIVMVLIVLYMGVGLKFFWLSFLLLFGAIALFNMVSIEGNIIDVLIPEGVAVVISYVIILVGSGILYLILNGSYKREYSKLTFDAQLKRAK